MTTTEPRRKSFVRVLPHKSFMEYIKEARRVKYIVEGEKGDFYQVKDNETGDLVFSGIKHSSGGWLTFSNTLLRTKHTTVPVLTLHIITT